MIILLTIDRLLVQPTETRKLQPPLAQILVASPTVPLHKRKLTLLPMIEEQFCLQEKSVTDKEGSSNRNGYFCFIGSFTLRTENVQCSFINENVLFPAPLINDVCMMLRFVPPTDLSKDDVSLCRLCYLLAVCASASFGERNGQISTITSLSLYKQYLMNFALCTFRLMKTLNAPRERSPAPAPPSGNTCSKLQLDAHDYQASAFALPRPLVRKWLKLQLPLTFTTSRPWLQISRDPGSGSSSDSSLQADSAPVPIPEPLWSR
ncbi:putative RNA-directed DNA polymerase from transposon X-element [Toxocara canis]|uniref:Putative RNA-directed DNA polymerase from transposon X-element n=1 Tax=Toxocara canis TaxID=6265 RepID=A0A0B2V8E2_TOXCA|nr:putative RNA-directed DNA polymerase from transposon X-element [Toxocara canis]